MKRVPRPLGFTAAVTNHKTTEKGSLNPIILNLILTQYVTNNYTLNHQQITMPQLSLALGIKPKQLTKKLFNITTKLYNINIADNNSIEQLMGTFLGLSTNHLFQDRALILEQVNNLKKAQGNEYKPYISATYNQALDTMLKSTKQFTEVFSSILNAQSKGSFTLVQNNNINKGIQTNNNVSSTGSDLGISVGEALSLINTGATGLLGTSAPESQGANLLPEGTTTIIQSEPTPRYIDPKQFQPLFTTHGIDQLESIHAHDQGTGMGKDMTDKDIEILKQRGRRKKVSHEDRRVEQYGIDLDDDKV